MATRSDSFTLAIQPDHQLLMSGRYQSFSTRWVDQIGGMGYAARLVDVVGPGGLHEQLADCDGFMWWFAHLPFPRNCAKRVLAAVEHAYGIPTFPDWRTVWHFDDKIAQHYLLEAAGVPAPRTWVFWDKSKALDFCRGARYPIVIKLASGIVSENVRLLRSFAEARPWIERLFGPGVVALAEGRVTRLGEARRRLRDAARILRKGGLTLSRRSDLQRDYLLVQEFLPGNEFDTRITVIGNRAFGFRRFNRSDDFRASGSGRIDWDPASIALDTVRLAFSAAHRLGTQSLAVDALRCEDSAVLVEISYYYEAWAVQACPGHWVLAGEPKDGELHWVDGEVRPDDAILEDFIDRLQARLAPASRTSAR
jgi:hypothetical protein